MKPIGRKTVQESLFGFDEKAASRILGVAPRTLRAWRKAGLVAHYVTPGGRIRYTMDQLLDLQRSARVDAAHRRELPLNVGEPAPADDVRRSHGNLPLRHHR